MNRQEAIEMLINLGCKDLTTQIHPRKLNKYYFRYHIGGGSVMDFNIDYPAYNELWVHARRRNIDKQIKFADLPSFLASQSINIEQLNLR